MLVSRAAIVLPAVLACALAQSGGGAAPPEKRAIAYLAREVPRWSAEHQCFSCHNNGDGARALYRAARASFTVPRASLEDTTRWLEHPSTWDSNGGDRRAADKGLARLQFAHAVLEAVDAGRIRAGVLTSVGEMITEGQGPDGAWQINAAGLLGSPATYGNALATAVARRILARADAARYRDRIASAERSLRRARPESVLDAAAVLYGLTGAGAGDPEIRRCRDLVTRGQSKEGGWGPTPKSAPEPFDTAVVLVALSGLEPDPELSSRIRHGRAFLVSTQLADGSWQETTRPPLGESYAQRISTAGWVLTALLATR
jgi:hypothetical protein